MEGGTSSFEFTMIDRIEFEERRGINEGKHGNGEYLELKKVENLISIISLEPPNFRTEIVDVLDIVVDTVVDVVYMSEDVGIVVNLV